MKESAKRQSVAALPGTGARLEVAYLPLPEVRRLALFLPASVIGSQNQLTAIGAEQAAADAVSVEEQTAGVMEKIENILFSKNGKLQPQQRWKRSRGRSS